VALVRGRGVLSMIRQVDMARIDSRESGDHGLPP
jgi:hypothetical protein